ncbi:hypothetical protein D9613_008449 [Agrocybe pediades]|uniref:Uncharacterized protein n=1 Tax=Agrocybe pediades TaxID=84607 RepID=A0A8H4QSZ5_9AGAR|nr:hypothetical protein D9613_008449 [Agrocybe pediades]
MANNLPLDSFGIDDLLNALDSKINDQANDGGVTRNEMLLQWERLIDISRTFAFRLNSTNPTSKLPPELLSRIFSLLQGHRGHQFPPPMKDEMLGFNSWLSVTKGCFTCTVPALALQVEFTLDETYFTRTSQREDLQMFYNAIGKAQERIVGIHISVPEPSFTESAALKLLLLRLPSITSVHIRTPIHFDQDFFSSRGQMQVSPRLCSSLTKLSLSGLIDVPPPLFNRLTDVALVFVQETQINFGALFHFLSPFAGSLTTLFVKHKTQRGTFRTLHSLETLHLPHLKDIEIRHSSPSLTVAVIQKIRMPAVANISWSTRGHLFCVVFTTAEFQFPPQQYLEPATRLSLKNTVKTDTIGGGSVELRGEAITLSASFPKKEKSITDTQQITAWPMPNIKYLEVETSKPPPVSEAFWGLLFRKLDLVEKIRVEDGRRAVRDFASFISRIDEHRYVEGTLLPLLSHVLIWVDEKCDATEELMHLSK